MEYCYTQLETANAHIWFPCFDQPNIKAPYELLVLAPSDWVVVSTCPDAEAPFTDKSAIEAALTSFNAPTDLTSVFGDQSYSCSRFEKSQPISTYLYSLVAGPYTVMHPPADVDYRLSMRLLCRKSLEKYVVKIRDDWFRVTRCGIDFYE